LGPDVSRPNVAHKKKKNQQRRATWRPVVLSPKFTEVAPKRPSSIVPRFSFLSVTQQLKRGAGRLSEVSRSHTIRYKHSVNTSQKERSVRRTDHYLHNTEQITGGEHHALSGIRTRDPNSQAASGLHLRQHGNGIRIIPTVLMAIFMQITTFHKMCVKVLNF